MGARRGLASLITMSSKVSARTLESLRGSRIEGSACVGRVFEHTPASARNREKKRIFLFTTEDTEITEFNSCFFSVPSVFSVVKTFFPSNLTRGSIRRSYTANAVSVVVSPARFPAELPDSRANLVLDIANCNVIIAYCNMKLGEKIRYLRLVEGTLRGMGREMTQQDLVVALKKEMGSGLSQSYVSQIESGARPHLTNASRMLLARFFKVHPGYLVDDPEGYHTELTSDLRAMEDRLDLWLINGAEQFARDPEVNEALLQVAKHKDSRKCLLLLGAILEAPELVDRLTEVLKPGAGEPNGGARRRKSAGAIL